MITDKDIQVVRLPEDPDNPFQAITFEAHLRLSSSHMIAPDSIDFERDPVKVKAMIEKSLRKRVLHHVYGDLRFRLDAAQNRFAVLQVSKIDRCRVGLQANNPLDQAIR